MGVLRSQILLDEKKAVWKHFGKKNSNSIKMELRIFMICTQDMKQHVATEIAYTYT